MAKGQRDSNREAFWRGVLARHRDSGLSIRAFCRRERLSEPSFYAWRRELARRNAERPARGASGRKRPGQTPPAFVPVVVSNGLADDRTEAITIHWGRGERVRVLRLSATTPAERLGELVRAVESATAPAEGGA